MSKQDPNKEATIRQLYTELNKFGSNGEWEKAKKVANRSKIICKSFVLHQFKAQ